MSVCKFAVHADACTLEGSLQLDVRGLFPSASYSRESGFSVRLGVQRLPLTLTCLHPSVLGLKMYAAILGFLRGTGI